MNRKLLISILAVTMICASAGVGTMAYFSSQAVSEANTFVAGTLVLGGVIDNEDVAERFATLNMSNLKPGEPVHLGTTVLKNVGTLPFKLYRMTASNIDDPNGLDGVLNLTVKIGGEQVFTGRLSQLVEANGGYFDPIYNVQPGEEKNMDIEIMMDSAAGNIYQGKTATCDLTVYAAQNELPANGEPPGEEDELGGTSGLLGFSVAGTDKGSEIWFDWDWTFNDVNYEYYELNIKHETGYPTTDIHETRIRIFLANHTVEVVNSDDGITAGDVSVDWNGDIVKLNKDAFPDDWDGFEVQFAGKRLSFGNIERTDYTWWSLNR